MNPQCKRKCVLPKGVVANPNGKGFVFTYANGTIHKIAVSELSFNGSGFGIKTFRVKCVCGSTYSIHAQTILEDGWIQVYTYYYRYHFGIFNDEIAKSLAQLHLS